MKSLDVLRGTVWGAAGFLTSGAATAESRPSSRGVLLAANKADQTIGLIDPEAGKMFATVKEDGFTAHEVIASPDGRYAYAPIYGNSGVGMPGTDGQAIDVINIAARKLVRTVKLARPVRPHCAMFGPRDGRLYVSTELADAITVFDPASMKVVATLPTGQKESHMLALSHDGKRAYTANVGPGTVSVIEIAARKTRAIIPISANTQRIAVSMDDRYVFTADQTRPRLAVISTAANKLARWIPLPAVAYGTAPTLDGRWLLVTLPDLNAVGVVNLKTAKLARQVAVGKYPQEIVVRPDNQVAYVSCLREGKVAALNLTAWKMDQLISAGRHVDGLAWASKD
jgi:DNA-binding beta-propeller fold protein YncE